MRLPTILLASLLAAGPVLASDDEYRCSGTQSDAAQTRDEVKTHFENQGWEIRRIKTEDGCYEIYAIDDQNQRREVYVDPATLDIVYDDKR